MIVPPVRQSSNEYRFPKRVGVPRKAGRVFKRGQMAEARAICALTSEEKASATEDGKRCKHMRFGRRSRCVLGDKCKIDAQKVDRGSGKKKRGALFLGIGRGDNYVTRSMRERKIRPG